MVLPSLVLLIHLVATCFMAGLIWFVQVVHYPLFLNVGSEHFTSYEREHCRLTTFVVGPAMIVESVTGVLLFYLFDFGNLVTINLVFIALIWFSTYAVQVPAHSKLSIAFDIATHARLVNSNWLRTFLWSVRVLVVGILMAEFTISAV